MSVDAARALLLDTGADRIDHPGGTLLAHLERTAATLDAWGARPALVVAGLCHAVYGTDGFPLPLVDIADRARVVAAIGVDAESVVWTYGASDRTVSWPPNDEPASRAYRDRFTGVTRTLSTADARDYWELTTANELDLWRRIPDGAAVVEILGRADAFLSAAARDAVRDARQSPACG